MPKSQYNFSLSMEKNYRFKAEIERLKGGSLDISSNHMFQHETHDNVEIKNELENLE